MRSTSIGDCGYQEPQRERYRRRTRARTRECWHLRCNAERESPALAALLQLTAPDGTYGHGAKYRGSAFLNFAPVTVHGCSHPHRACPLSARLGSRSESDHELRSET